MIKIIFIFKSMVYKKLVHQVTDVFFMRLVDGQRIFVCQPYYPVFGGVRDNTNYRLVAAPLTQTLET